MKSGRPGFPEFVLLAASIGVVLLLAEVTLRMFGFSPSPFVARDPRLGPVLRPGAEGWWRLEGEAYVRINSDGLRDREHQWIKPPGTLRIAVLGDSFSEAKHVDAKDAYWAVLERELASCVGSWGKTRVEVINFGRAGDGTARELVSLREKVWKYDPDIVLLQFFFGNDLANNHPALNGHCGPFFTYDTEGRLQSRFRDCGDHAGLRRRFAELRLLQLIRMASNRIAQAGQLPSHVEFDRTLLDDPDAVEPGLWSQAFQPPDDKTWREAWEITEGLIRLMCQEVRSHDAAFWVVTATYAMQVHPERAKRDAFEERFGEGSLLYADRRIEALGVRENTPVILLAPRFQAYAEQTNEFLHGFSNTALGTGHWNESGHRLAGQIIAHEMCSARATPQGEPTRVPASPGKVN